MYVELEDCPRTNYTKRVIKTEAIVLLCLSPGGGDLYELYLTDSGGVNYITENDYWMLRAILLQAKPKKKSREKFRHIAKEQQK
jgi:hypothetical protein